MSDKYFYEAQRKIITVEGNDLICKYVVDVAKQIYDEAIALRLEDEAKESLKE